MSVNYGLSFVNALFWLLALLFDNTIGGDYTNENMSVNLQRKIPTVGVFQC